MVDPETFYNHVCFLAGFLINLTVADPGFLRLGYFRLIPCLPTPLFPSPNTQTPSKHLRKDGVATFEFRMLIGCPIIIKQPGRFPNFSEPPSMTELSLSEQAIKVQPLGKWR